MCRERVFDKDGTAINVFSHIAENCLFTGRTPAELCDHNASIYQGIGYHQHAQVCIVHPQNTPDLNAI